MCLLSRGFREEATIWGNVIMKRLIVDLPSISWTCLFAGKDEEFGYEVTMSTGRTVYVNSYKHGYENAINLLVSAWLKLGIQPKDTILVEETGNTLAFRKRFIPTYKAGRSDNRPEEYFKEYRKLVDELKFAIFKLGGTTVNRPNMEADDMIAYLVENLQGEKVIWTSDGDLSVLLSDEVSLWRNGELLEENPYGPFDVKLIPVYKALVGDSSDKIPGAKGFCDKAFLNVLSMFEEEGVYAIEEMIKKRDLSPLEGNIEDLKAIKNIVENKEEVISSYSCGKLYPNLVYDIRYQIKWFPGYLHQAKDISDERLQPFGGSIKLIHQGNVDSALKAFEKYIYQGRHVALDIETSVPDESIDWLKEVKDTDDESKLGVDVMGSKLTGLSMTFGFNQRHTYYFTVDHKEQDGISNLSSDQVLEFIKLIPEGMPIVVHNSGFEQPVLYNTWGDKLSDNGWHGFLPSVHDTSVLANYVDENKSTGLKGLSKRYFDYDQVDYATVTQGRRMNELTAVDVLSYGADDTIMTSSLYDFFKIICETEHSWYTYLKFEVKPAYVTALAFVQGANLDLPRMAQLQKQDEERSKELQKIIDDYLIKLGWEGTVCPLFKAEDLDEAKKLKEIFLHMVGVPLKTMVRTPSKIIALVEAGLDVPEDFSGSKEDFDLLCQEFATFCLRGDISSINEIIKSRFDGRPNFDIRSPKQVSNLLYNELDLPIRVINPLTPLQRANQPELASAVSRFNEIEMGSSKATALTSRERELLKAKASTDDTAISFALLEDLDDETREFLNAFAELKEIGTRFNMFYTKYKNISHWKTGKLHANVRLSSTVTRRTTSSNPNLQQLPKQGSFREVFVPHRKNGFIVSIDYNAQELRAQAELSRDGNFLACYIGDNKRDIHSMTAASLMRKLWGDERVDQLEAKYGINDPYFLFMALRKSEDKEERGEASKLRNQAKVVNFLSAYGGTEQGLSKSLLCSISDAKTFLDAKHKTFPRYEEWKDEVEFIASVNGYVELEYGGRRHLQEAVLSDNSWERERASRQASNFHIQSSCALQTKLAMANLWDSGALFKFDAQFIAPIHDELVCSVSQEDALEFTKVMHESMVQPFWKIVPVVAEVSFGPNFADQYEVGEYVDEAVFNKHKETIIEKRGY
ncbi:DNA polymerase I, thermostable [Oligella urethralis]|uniref:DNA-directed DNA polymerase n=1 Tax=Oligella urethralis TaxID=90245 RepID=A0A2X1WHI7_9BURK|nr:DNA polymerase I, thermostable [Oligella urethralis]